MKYTHKITSQENVANKEVDAHERRKALAMGDGEAVIEEKDCMISAFFREQQKLPPRMRSNAAYISCPCPRCTITL